MKEVGELASNRKWRGDHPELWNRQKQRRRDKNRRAIGATKRKWVRWTLEEVCRIMAENRPIDDILSRELGRPISAIQTLRSLIRKGKVKWHDGQLRRVVKQVA